MAREIGNPPQLWKTLVALGDLRPAQGRQEEAAGAYGEALAVIGSVVGGPTHEQLRRTFLPSEHVRRIRDLAGHAAAV